ncbi:histidine phosphatase family protein [Bacillus pseudomycoides]|uniref:Histidine phosphatase family protein n=1 Tax=Bacillus bingmayongensis TaxID=1150157 RepID=A0ABU5K4V0_9BACI|nr:histidine phosphatase family protein [Bacillus pseudomycoides]
MTTTIYFIRHGQTKWNLEKRLQGHMDSPLTKNGELQAKNLSNHLKCLQFDTIYSSSSPRAMSTAKIISKEKAEIIQLDELREINMGFWEGKEIKQIQASYVDSYKQFFEEPHLYLPINGGETFIDLLKRMVSILEEIISTHEGKTILIVSHRFSLKTILNYYSGNALKELKYMPDIPPASLSKVTINKRYPSVELYGDTSHYD